MATITTDTFLDGGTARTAGETWTVNNGAILTIRTDTRWHANAPASMTGSISSMTTSTGDGGFFIDGTQVRWIAFSGGSGNVPAINTAITQAAAPGVTGTLLGVWSSLDAAPSAVGSALPSTGFLKFREVTGGVFDSAGAFTGIDCSAASAEGPGWIEVVRDQSTLFTPSSLGMSVDFTGEWFSLGTTSGSAAQVLQIPTNGGGAATPVAAIQIETSPGSNVFEWWPAQSAANGFTTTNLDTDARAKVVEHLGGGQVRIGGSGAPQVGMVPSAGCVIRIPNVFLRTCTTAARAANTAPTNLGIRPQLAAAAGGFKLKIDKVVCDWYFAISNCDNPVVRNSAIRDSIQFFLCRGFTYDTCVIGATGSSFTVGVVIANCSGGTVNYAKTHVVSSTTAVQVTSSENVTFNNPTILFPTVSNATRQLLSITSSTALVFNDLSLIGGHVIVQQSSYVSFFYTDYVELTKGAVTGTNQNYAVFDITQGSSNILFDGFTYGLRGVINNVFNTGRLFQTANCRLVKARNFGSPTAVLQSGNSSNAPSILNSLGGESDISFQRMFFSTLRLITAGSTPKKSSNFVFEHIRGGGGVSGGFNVWFQDSAARGIDHSVNTTGSTGNNGFHWIDSFINNSAGTLSWIGNPSTADTSSLNTFTAANPLSAYVGDGRISLKTAGDFLVSETPYWIRGYTSFSNTAPTLVGQVGTHTVEYQLNTGSGFSAWKTLNSANLTTESISPTGFKLRLRITAATTSNSNLINTVRIAMSTDSVARDSNLYPLDQSALTLTGLQPGSEVRCYTGTDPATAVEIGGTESSGTTFSFTHEAGGAVGYIRIFALGYQPLTYDPYTFSADDTSLLIQQVVDRNYVNP